MLGFMLQPNLRVIGRSYVRVQVCGAIKVGAKGLPLFCGGEFIREPDRRFGPEVCLGLLRSP